MGKDLGVVNRNLDRSGLQDKSPVYSTAYTVCAFDDRDCAIKCIVEVCAETTTNQGSTPAVGNNVGRDGKWASA
jgi:hypothetical protein